MADRKPPPTDTKPAKISTPQLPPAATRLGERDTLQETFALAHGEVALLHEQGGLVGWKLGERLRTIHDLKLYKEGGFKSFGAYLDALRGSSRSKYWRLIARADAVTKDIARTVDAERIELATRLLPHKKGKAPLVSQKTLDGLEVTVEREGRSLKVKFAEALTSELQDAARKRTISAKVAPSPAVVAEASKLERRFGRGVTAVAEVKAVRVGGRDALAIVVPEDRIAEFMALLKNA